MLKTYTIRTPGALMYLEVPFKGLMRYFKPSRSGPPYNTIVTIVMDEEHDTLVVVDDEATIFTEFALPPEMENPGAKPGSEPHIFYT